MLDTHLILFLHTMPITSDPIFKTKYWKLQRQLSCAKWSCIHFRCCRGFEPNDSQNVHWTLVGWLVKPCCLEWSVAMPRLFFSFVKSNQSYQKTFGRYNKKARHSQPHSLNSFFTQKEKYICLCRDKTRFRWLHKTKMLHKHARDLEL